MPGGRLGEIDGLGHFKAFWGAPQVDGEVGTNKTPVLLVMAVTTAW